MRELKIAYGWSSSAKQWKNSTITWEELCEKLTSTVRTKETVQQYKEMSKPERDAIKDRGGFVGGHLKDGRRLARNVVCRSMLSLDVDFADPDFIEQFTENFKFASVLYSTHSHTPEAPRVRIIIPLAEDISPDAYVAASRLFADQWGIEQFDSCSYKVNQLMYWPTTPADGKYVCHITDGPFLDAMQFLSAFDWQDCSKLPVSSREQKVRRNDGKMLEDPLTKDGIVGAFCRTYSITDVIRKYLSNVYAESAAWGRYDYIPGEGSCGVVVYDDKFVYSHHATDPAGGKLLNAFDLVRLHRFPDDDEKTSFLKMAELAEDDDLVKETQEAERLAAAKEEFTEISSSWEEPIPFGRYDVEEFPVDALPAGISEYVQEVAESTQTPVDMAGTAALTLIAVCIQGKFVIRGKADWTEPLNLFSNVIASPSERKSAVLHAVARPLDNYELQFNQENAARVEGSKMQKKILEKRQRTIIDQVAKGKTDKADLERIAEEIAGFEEETPLQLYVDDITTEKLVSVMGSNKGRAALVSSEGGIFDTLAGIYTRNVNIDVMLKGYSGDTIRVDRIGRESESIMNPTLTILLMTQPKVISDVFGNATFRGRGLTARFLYCLPDSAVGERRFQSRPVKDETYQQYEKIMINMLEEEYSPQPEVIFLSEEAQRLLTNFAEELEPKLKKEYAEIADWAGKLVGNILRIAGLLSRASVLRQPEFLTEPDPIMVTEDIMASAIRLGRYFLSHALVVFDVVPEACMHKQAKKILKMIAERRLSGFNRREAMRYCRNFKTVDEIQPVLDFLDDYGYIAEVSEAKGNGRGRPPLPKYVVNPSVLSLMSNP